MNIKVIYSSVPLILELPSELLKYVPGAEVYNINGDIPDIRIKCNGDKGEFYIKTPTGIILQEVCRLDQVVFKLMIEIEQVFCSKIELLYPQSICLHGGLVSAEEKSLLILGKKGAGKSTMMSLLLTMPEVKYYSDDVVIYNGGNLQGIPIPQRLRMNDKGQLREVLGQGMDFSGHHRFFSMPKLNGEGEVKPNIIVIPHYNEMINCCVLKSGQEKLMGLVENLKSISGVEDVYNTLGQLARHTTMYEVSYYDNGWMLDQMQRVWLS